MSTDAFDSRATRLASLVRRVRRSLVATVLVAGLLLALAIALAWVVAGVVIDLMLPLSVTGRQAMWCGWWLAVAAACGVFLIAPAMRWPVLETVAMLIERTIGDVHNQLLTVVDLARRGDTAIPAHGPDGRRLRPDMVERLLEQTQERIRGFRSARVLPWRTLLRNMTIAAAAAGCIILLAIGLGDRFITTMQRLLDPTADIPPATWLQVRSSGDLEVLEGEPLEIHGRVVRGSVETASLVIFDAAGRPTRQPMRSDGDGGFVTILDGLDRAARYRIEASNTWTKTHAIAILERPEIRSVTCHVQLPDYMRIDAPIPVAADAQRIEAPEASRVEFEITASADTASGALHLLERSLAREVVERFDDRVWFEDDLPRDAVSDAPWKWTTTQAAGGLRSFTCGTEAEPLAMRTRLEPLILPREQPESRAFTLMARLDPTDPPTRLTVLLEHGQSKTQLVWGPPPTAPPPAGASRVAAGSLPRPGEWGRLSASIKSLGQAAGQAVTAATFMVDRGRAVLDRPGWVEKSDEVVTRPVDTQVGEIPLVAGQAHDPPSDPLDEGTRDGLWKAGLSVTHPLWVRPELRSRHGHANLPTPPIAIVPTVDHPPSIVVDAMPETLVLKVADDVPLTGRGFDDWGVDEVCVLAGPDPARLEVRVTLPGASPTLRPPVTQVSIATALSSEMLGLAAGKSAVWKLRIRDTKGQIAETKLFRVSVLTPPESDLAKTQVPALAQARREAQQLAREAEKKAAEADAKLEVVREALTADEKPVKRDVDELAARLDRERRMADQLAKMVEKSSEQAARSDLVPQPHKEILAELAAEARSLERWLAGSVEQKPAAAPDQPAERDRDASRTGEQMPPPTPAQRADAAKAERVAASPSQADVREAAERLGERLEEVGRRLDAQGAALQINALAQDLEQRAERLAPPRPTQVDSEKTKQQIRDIEQILGKKIAPPLPDTAPISDKAAPQAAADAATKAIAAPDGTKLAATPRAAAAPAKSTPDDVDADTPPMPTPAAQTPADLAEQAAAAAAEAATSATGLVARLAGTTPQPKAAVAPTMRPFPADRPSDGASQETPAADLGGLLESDDVREALAMAERARRLQAREAALAEAAARAAAAESRARNGRKTASAARGDAAETAQADARAQATAAASDGGAMAGSTALESSDSLRGLDARQRAALYKLPPHVRDPLLDGMRQRGPAAYQGVIDTYFRQLGKDIPQ